MIRTILCLLVLSCLFVSNAQAHPFMKIETIPAPEGNWTYIPEGSGEMTIHVETYIAKQIKVWRVPTGTQQWENRKLVCEESGNKDKWDCVWRYDKDETIHDHFVVQVFGEDWDIQDSINVTRRHAEDVPPFEKPYLEIGYKSVGEAIKECEALHQRELLLPIKLPPMQFTHHLARCVNDELQIEYLHEAQGKNHYNMDVRPIEQRIDFEKSKRGQIKYKLNDGSEAIYFTTKTPKTRGGFNILVFEKNGWQYRLSVDSRIGDQVTADVLVGIAESVARIDRK